MPRDPPSEMVFFDHAYNNLTACYEEGNIGSAIGEWILLDRAGQDFTYLYFNSLRNTDRQSNGYEVDHGPVNISAFLPHALLLLVMIVAISHVLHFFLRRLGQSLFVSQMIAGILIDLFLNKGRHVDSIDHYMLLQPKNRRLEEAFSIIGIFCNLFLAGLKMDASSTWRAGKKPFIIAVTGISIPILTTFLAYLCICNKIGNHTSSKHNFFWILVAISCHSFFFAQTEVLSEQGLLSSELGRLALSASIIQDFMLYSAFPVFDSIRQSQLAGGKNILMHLFSFAIMLSFILLIVRPYALWVVRNTPSHARVREVHITLITILVIMMALGSDIIGAPDIAIMGLAMPSGPPLGTALIRRLDLVATELLLPIFFIAGAGREMDWAAAGQELSHGLWLGMLMLIASITKVVTVAISAAYCGFPLKSGALLGLVMNFKGIMETIILIEFRLGRAISGATYTYLILMVVAVTSISSLLVSIFYKPLDKEFNVCKNVMDLKTQSELRIITCFFNDKPIPSLLDLFEWLTSFMAQHCTCVYVIHLKELKACSKSNLISHHKGKDQIDTMEMNPIHNHLITFAQKKKERVAVMPFTSIVPQENLHQDICSLIVERAIALVILPFPRKNSMADAEADQHERGLIPIVLEHAQCSVGIMVYHSFTRITQTLPTHQFRIGVLFMGGPDDREAVAIAGHIAYHPYVHISILRFCISSIILGEGIDMEEFQAREQKLDDEVIGQLLTENVNNDRLAISEVTIDDPVQIILVIRSLGEKYDMLIVGRRRAHSSPLNNEALTEWTESPELGVIGDLLASPDFKTPSNILVVQQHGSS